LGEGAVGVASVMVAMAMLGCLRRHATKRKPKT
jgi:hypothetical protein